MTVMTVKSDPLKITSYQGTGQILVFVQASVGNPHWEGSETCLQYSPSPLRPSHSFESSLVGSGFLHGRGRPSEGIWGLRV